MEQQMVSPNQGIVAFLSDFGLSDGYVGVMKGVVLGIAPRARLLDISHDIAPQDIVAGAWVLSTSYRFFPEGTIFTCIVDPGVGSARRSLALHIGKWYFVGPDNGLFSHVLAEQPLYEAVSLTNPTYHLAQTSHTFHGRDIFSPAAAHLARGVALSELGEAVTANSLQRLTILPATLHEGRIEAQVTHIDHFGNIITNIATAMVPNFFERPGIRMSFPTRGIVVEQRRRFFASSTTDEQGPFMYGGSSGHLAVAIRDGNAAQTLGIVRGIPVILTTGEPM